MRRYATPILSLLKAPAAAGLLLAMTACAHQPAPLAAVPVPPIPAGEARIWVYRTYEPYADHWLPAVYANGATIGWAQLGGAFYRDVAPGHYHMTAQTWGVDLNQSSDLDLAAGQQAYIRIVSAPEWFTISEPRLSYERPTYYAWSILPQVAAAEIAPLAFNGGS
jgi:hypothetical protein